jgi:BASS family bile acid:Na+ symporter
MPESTAPLGLLSVVIASMTLLLGVQLQVAHLRAVLTRPRGLLIGLAGQFLFLPLLAILLFYAYPAPPSLKAGWFIIAAVPGGAMSNTVTFVGRGTLSLSMVLTGCSTLAGIVTIPLWTSLGLRLAGGEGSTTGLPVAAVLLGSFAFLIVPLTVGIAVAAWRPSLAGRLHGPTRRVMLAMVLFSMAAYVSQRWEFIVRDFDIGVVFGAAVFNIVAVLGGWNLAGVFGLDMRDRFTIGIEVGFQNLVVAMLVAELLGRSDLLPFIGSHGLTMLVLLVPLLAVLARAATRVPASDRAS